MMMTRLRNLLRKDCESAISGVQLLFAARVADEVVFLLAKLGTGSKILMRRLQSWIEGKLQRSRHVWPRLFLRSPWAVGAVIGAVGALRRLQRQSSDNLLSSYFKSDWGSGGEGVGPAHQCFAGRLSI